MRARDWVGYGIARLRRLGGIYRSDGDPKFFIICKLVVFIARDFK